MPMCPLVPRNLPGNTVVFKFNKETGRVFGNCQVCLALKTESQHNIAVKCLQASRDYREVEGSCFHFSNWNFGCRLAIVGFIAAASGIRTKNETEGCTLSWLSVKGVNQGFPFCQVNVVQR